MLETTQSRARRLTDPKGISREHYLGDYLSYLSVVRDGVILLRDGDVMASFAVEGVNADTTEGTLIDDVAQAMSANVAQAEADTAFYVHRFSHEADPAMPPVPGDGFAAEIDRHWQSTLHGMDLRQRTTMVTVVIRPQTLSTLWAKLTGGSRKSGRELMERRIAKLEETVATMMQALSATGPERLMASDGRWLGYLKMMTTGTFTRVQPPRDFRPVRDLITESRVDFRGDRFFVAGMDSADMRWGAMFSLKGYPTETVTGMLGHLDLPANTVVSHSFTPIDMVPALSRVQRTARQMSAADDAAISARDDLVAAADDLASGRISFGHHQLTIMVTTRTQDELDALSSRLRTALQRIQGVPVREDIGARSAYFAQHPGNFAHRARPAMISSACFADFAALHGANKGLRSGEEPWGAPITTLPTLTGEPYRFNFHLAGRSGRPDRGPYPRHRPHRLGQVARHGLPPGAGAAGAPADHRLRQGSRARSAAPGPGRQLFPRAPRRADPLQPVPRRSGHARHGLADRLARRAPDRRRGRSPVAHTGRGARRRRAGERRGRSRPADPAAFPVAASLRR